MSNPNPYRKSYFNTQPDFLFPAYRSTVKRAPTQPLVQIPQTLSEITGPLFCASDVADSEWDLTAQHAGEPLGERMFVSGRLLDEGGRPVPPGTTGRLRVRGLAVGTPLTDSDEFRGGWYYPGEVAALDARDYLYIEGRASDVIMRGGAKIYPSEIEAALREHAGVADVAVIGTRAADNEETIVADRKSTRLNSSHMSESRMPSSA